MADEQSIDGASGVAEPARRLGPRIRRPLAIGAAVAAALLFVSTVALLYWQGLNAEEPTATIVVEASEAFKGATVRVEEGVGLSKPLEKTLDEQTPRDANNNYRVPFYVVGGVYRVTVTHGARTAATGEVSVRERQTLPVSLDKLFDKSATRAATGPR